MSIFAQIHKTTFVALGLLVAYSLILATIGFFETAQIESLIFSEEGYVERATIGFWLIAAISLLPHTRRTKGRSLAFTALFTLFAMREADLHKAFTSESMMKISFYSRGMGPEQWNVLPITLAILAVVIYCIIRICTYLYKGGWRTISGQLLVISLGVLVGSKILDRLPSVLRKDFNIMIDPLLRKILYALEEGLEMATPLLFLWSVWMLCKNEDQAKVSE